jgi:hypothetical protein
LGQKAKDRAWKKESRLDAYTEVMTTSELLVLEATVVRGLDRGTPELARAADDILKGVAEMYRAANRVQILGSPEVAAASHALTVHCGKVIGHMAVQTPKGSDSEWTEARVNEHARLYGHFLDVARRDLQS